jgi:hypothetical protein
VLKGSGGKVTLSSIRMLNASDFLVAEPI